MPGKGWCADVNGQEGTARKFLSNTNLGTISASCKADDSCAGFAFALDTLWAVVYTSTGCTSGCDNTAWNENSDLIKKGSNTDVIRWRNAVCYRKKPGK